MTPLTILGVALAGGVGAALRYIVDALVMRGRQRAFPLGILTANVVGSLLLGLVTGLGGALGGETVTILGVGMLGGFTTFSTVSVESVLLARQGRRPWALLNLGGTLVLALIAAAVGLSLGRAFTG